MRILAIILGLLLLLVVLWDTFEAIVLPRSVTRRLRLTSVFYRASWTVWAGIARRLSDERRSAFLGFFGPLSLLWLISVWAVSLILGFALVQWGLGLPLAASESHPGFGTYLYLSGTTFLTLGYGDVTPVYGLARTVAVLEAGVGFGMLAIVISYLPVLYQSFSRREVGISLLDARAGSPPTAAELLIRHSRANQMDELAGLLREWERWSAELLESHLSYPVLTYYRSQHDRESWLAALTAILDACALVSLGFRDHAAWQDRLLWQARMTFAMARHAVVDLAIIFNIAPSAPDPDRLPYEQWARLRADLDSAGIPLTEGEPTEARLIEWRRKYEPYVNALAHHLFESLPPWMLEEREADNWQTSAWDQAAHF